MDTHPHAHTRFYLEGKMSTCDNSCQHRKNIGRACRLIGLERSTFIWWRPWKEVVLNVSHRGNDDSAWTDVVRGSVWCSQRNSGSKGGEFFSLSLLTIRIDAMKVGEIQMAEFSLKLSLEGLLNSEIGEDSWGLAKDALTWLLGSVQQRWWEEGFQLHLSWRNN